MRSATAGAAIALLAALGLAAPSATAAEGPPALPDGCSQPSVGGTVTCTFDYTGSEQTFAMPVGIDTVHVVAVGAPGGGFGGVGGAGAVVAGDITATPGSTLYVEVGGPGGDDGPASAPGGAGGFNGGGNGDGGDFGANSMPGGGGASDVRTSSGGADPAAAGLASRLIVAAGGGGDGQGNAGGDAGQPGAGGFAGAGPGGGAGTASAGGAAGSLPGTAGELGQGGIGGPLPPDTCTRDTVEDCVRGGGGGGGGLYGGGGGGDGTGGGGGSSLVPAGGTFAIADDSTPASVTISYTPAGLASLTLSPASTTVTAGAAVSYEAAGYTAEGATLDISGDDIVFAITDAAGDPVDGASCAGAECSATKAGDYTVTATDGSATGQASLTVTAGAAAQLTKQAGDGQTAPSGSVFPEPLMAAITDEHGNPAGAGTTVTFAVTAGSASFAGGASAPVTANDEGWAIAPDLTAGDSAGPVTVTASADGLGSVTFDETVLAVAPPLTVSTTDLPNGTVGEKYQAALQATGGADTDYVWSLADGALPPGLELSADGVISGTPTDDGAFDFTVSVNDPATADLTITIEPVAATSAPTSSSVPTSTSAPATTNPPATSADSGTETVEPSATDGASLPDTGFEPWPAVRVGLLLLFAGVALMVGARTRRRGRHS
jgi:adhesin/invasin